MPYVFNPFTGTLDWTASSQAWSIDQTPTPAPDGVTTVFTTPAAYVAGSLRVILNGQVLTKVNDYTETSNTTFTFVAAPLTGDVIRVDYRTA